MNDDECLRAWFLIDRWVIPGEVIDLGEFTRVISVVAGKKYSLKEWGLYDYDFLVWLEDNHNVNVVPVRGCPPHTRKGIISLIEMEAGGKT